MRYTDEWILAAMHAVIDSADDTGCSDNLTVTSKAAVDRLRVVLGHARKSNEQARDLKRLVKLALEAQDAESRHGQVWDSEEMRRDFEVLAFCAPWTVVKRRADGVTGSLEFQHAPRLYWGFQEDKRQ